MTLKNQTINWLLILTAVLWVTSCVTAPVFSSFFSSSKGWTIISDFDDTLKQTNCTSKRSTIKNALFTQKTFTGMRTLLEAIHLMDRSKNLTTQFYVLSASPKVLKNKVKDLLQKFRFPKPKQILLRESLISFDIYAFKKKSLNNIIRSSGKNILLLGDNCDTDAKVYAELKRENPHLNIHVFIRSIKPTQPLPMTTNFVTPLEIVIGLKDRKAIDDNHAIKLVELLKGEILLSKNLIPDYAYCPLDYELFPGQPKQGSIKKAYLQVENKIESFCSSR